MLIFNTMNKTVLIVVTILCFSVRGYSQSEIDTTDSAKTLVTTKPIKEKVSNFYIEAGAGIEAKRMTIGLSVGTRFGNSTFSTKTILSSYKLTDTYSNEWNLAQGIYYKYDFLNYGFLHSWKNQTEKQYRWSPYVGVGGAVGVRHIDNYENIVSRDLNEYNLYADLEPMFGIEWSPKKVFGMYTNGWLKLDAKAGYIFSNLDGNYFNYGVGITWVFGY